MKLESSKVNPGPVLENMLEKGEISPYTIYLLNEANLCETYGWKPKDLSDMDPFIIDVYTAILRGKGQGD